MVVDVESRASDSRICPPLAGLGEKEMLMTIKHPAILR